MPAPLIRQYRLTEQAYEASDFGKELPNNKQLWKYLKKKNIRGRSEDEIASFRRRGPVTEEFGRGVASYALAVGTWPDMPENLNSMLQGLDKHQAFLILFEKLPDSEIPKAYEAPTDTNDVSVKGFRKFALIIGQALHDFTLPRKNKRESPLVYLDADSGFDDYARHINTETGYSQSLKGQHLTPSQAYIAGVDFLRVDADFHHRHADRLTNLNRDCIRYALDKDGHRVAITAAHAISNDGFKATLRGERRLGRYPSNELLSCGNNLVIVSAAETHDSETSLGTSWKRTIMMSSLMFQLALLIDPTDRQPLRFITFEIIKSNTTRSQAMGFEHVHTFKEEGKPDEKVVVCDPPSKENYRDRCILGGISTLIRYVRSCADGRPDS